MPTKIFVSQIDDTLNDGSPAPLNSIIYLGDDGPTWKLIEEIYPVGFKGSAGFVGSAGFRGSVGLFGEPGYQGSIGDDGFRGLTGFRGSIGYTSSVGFSGSTGYMGSFGDTGYSGSEGDFGITGYKGSGGDTGFQGSEGYRGSKGITGFTGSKGAIDPFNFIDLADVALYYNTYVGYENAYVRVNEFGDAISLDTTSLLSNTIAQTIHFNNNIVDKPVFKGYSETVVNNLVGASIVCNPLDGNIFNITLNNPVTTIELSNYITEPDIVAGNFYTLTLFIKQGDGDNTIDWTNVNYKIFWSIGDGVSQETGPSLSVTLNYIDVITVSTYDGGETWFGVLGAKGFNTAYYD